MDLCREVMSAPNLMRIGTPENIFVELQDYTGGGDVQVAIRVKSHPIPTREFASATVTLNSNNHFQAMGSVTVNHGLFHQRHPALNHRGESSSA